MFSWSEIWSHLKSAQNHYKTKLIDLEFLDSVFLAKLSHHENKIDHIYIIVAQKPVQSLRKKKKNGTEDKSL